ncbi:MAG: iron-sulfur cluster insertion protein ErpA [Hydrogenophaga sp.]|jgi:iron-sulfur cluster insertion protein|uniref:iron-sulfur cluster insertion protein ErpA n=1 Tax=Hydrogenophaga sp. TaxID=1904254 RepID=UPI00271714A9|nr:iron-sulfur cluster insertion protein ErpA [Hydrogenophaga sp.]MDO9479411.1 iron-sulfur cluster insertion protein ErpA [Hydrogenophaga sp.]MDP1894429.1 iron-sulfur cluster insertion protein ErpA [Hydrogenophaga sp.]MDP3343576.1 iron-sulfur cluster insertion protein ErpA [Hydrogenophaga sp.]MDP3807806.1 iron-sulfur cluster insertion protein ErpA [Hydrogenophaga sp.]MDP3923863.1 iron-sulfur cluster insertion protein ErpA [Hydrogenophaga sp.]
MQVAAAASIPADPIALPSMLEFTPAAAAKVAELILEEGNPNLKLRLYVTGGGCSGFSYGFAFDDQVNEDDTLTVTAGVALVVDAMSQQYVLGARVDFEDGLEGSRFVIHNPNAATTCGCGSSFSV